MASPLATNSIHAKSDLAIRNGAGKVNQPKTQFEAWSTTNIAENGQDGSNSPIALQLPNDAQKRYQLALKVIGTCLFPPDYPRVVVCRLVGALPNGPNGKPTVVLESEDWPITLPVTNLPSAITMKVDLVRFTSNAPLPAQICPVPFRWARDVEWKVMLIDDLPAKVQSVDKLRRTACTYNTISGKAAFGVGFYVGSFAIDDWLKPSNAPNNTLISSFDLSALLQLASGLLIDDDGFEVLDTLWDCKTPYGYVKPNMPFGLGPESLPPASWPEGVNNPFFSSSMPLIPYIQNLDLKDDTYRCNARAWIEARFSDDVTGVVDSSWNVFSIPSPVIGQQSREECAKAHIENSVGNLADGVDGGMWQGGDCSLYYSASRLSDCMPLRMRATNWDNEVKFELWFFPLDSLSLIYHKTGCAPTDLARIDCNNSFSTLQTGEEPRAPT